jgi:acetyltransferase
VTRVRFARIRAGPEPALQRWIDTEIDLMGQVPGATLDLEQLLSPGSIAVVGASAKKESQGYEYVQTMVEAGFSGPIYPVNPKLDELLGLKCYPDLESIPGDVDFVISAVPADAALDLVDGAIEKKAKLIHFYTARFSETGREDAAQLEAELIRRTREAGIRVIGPNCMGVHYPKNKISFDPLVPRNIGNVGILSQSGSHAFRIIGRAAERGVGFSKVISYGNAMDLNECDFLEHFAQDPDTDVIGAYIEGIRDGRRFLRALRSAATAKPVVVLKGGRTSAGRPQPRHTASLASQATVWQAAVRQAGALEVSSLNEMIDMLGLRARRPGGRTEGCRPGRRRRRNGGSADICNEAGLDVAPIPADLRESLKEVVPRPGTGYRTLSMRRSWSGEAASTTGAATAGQKPGLRPRAGKRPLAGVHGGKGEWGNDAPGNARAPEKPGQDNGKATLFVLGDSEP